MESLEAYTEQEDQYVEHSEGDGAKMFRAVCQLGLEGIVSKKLQLAVSLRPV